MAKCALCGKSGIFLSLNKDGYCKSCAEYKERQRQKEEQLRIKREKEAEKVSSLPKCNIEISNEPRKRNRAYPNPAFSNITPKGKLFDYVVFDTETTGLAPSKDRIVELAAIRFRGGFPVEVFHTYINPEMDIPKEATAVNKIKNEDVASAPTIESVIAAFDSFVGNDILVAHNLDFDLKFVFYSGSRILENNCKLIDTLEQAKKLLKSPKVKYDKDLESYAKDYDSDYDVTDYQLDTLCSYYNITLANHHSALFDAYATGKLFLRLVSEKQALPQNILDFLKN